jgi:hypothetical protein
MLITLAAFLFLQDDPDAKAKEALKAECALSFKDQKLNEALTKLAEVQGVCFVADPRSVPAPDKLVCKATKEGTVDSVLKELLTPMKLAHVVWENSVIVATPAACKEFEGGKVPVIGAKERAKENLPAWKKTIYDALAKPVSLDLSATIRFGKKEKTTFATAFQWIGEQTGQKIAVDGAAGAGECNVVITGTNGAVALALVCRQAGATFVVEQAGLKVRK